MSQVTLSFPMSPEEVLTALRENSTSGSAFPVSGTRERRRFLGQVGDGWFSLRLFPSWLYRSSGVGPVFTATVTAAPPGCCVTGTLGPDPMVQALLWLWLIFGFCWVGVGVILGLALKQRGRFAMAYSGLAWTFLGLGVIGAFWLAGRFQRKKLIRLVVVTLTEDRQRISDRA